MWRNAVTTSIRGFECSDLQMIDQIFNVDKDIISIIWKFDIYYVVNTGFLHMRYITIPISAKRDSTDSAGLIQ